MDNKKKFASFSPTVRRVISQRVFLSAIIAVLCVLLANTLAIRNPKKIVLAKSANHNLSPLTKKVLESLTNDVRVVVLFDKQSDLFDPVRNLLIEYERISTSVKLEFVDLARDPARAEEVQQELRLPANAPNSRILFSSQERVKIVNDSELSILDFSEFMDKRVARRTHFVGEKLFTSAIVAVNEGTQTKVGFVTGHSEHKASDQGGQWGYSKFSLMLQQKGFLLQEISLSGTNSIPADCRLLVIPGPRTPYGSGEFNKLREYLDTGGNLFTLFNFYSLQRPSGLETFLEEYGFEIGINQVSDSKNEQSGKSGLLLVDDLGSHPITKPILGSRLQMVLPRSIGYPKPDEGADDQSPITVLASSSDSSQAIIQTQDKKGAIEKEGKVPLMAAKIHVNERQAPARIVVTGDSLFLGNSAFEAGANRDFANLAVNWLLERTHLLEIEARAVTEYRINLSSAEMNSITWVLLLLLPGGTLGIGLLWWRRQMKR
jgi:hypothetical protein